MQGAGLRVGIWDGGVVDGEREFGFGSGVLVSPCVISLVVPEEFCAGGMGGRLTFLNNVNFMYCLVSTCESFVLIFVSLRMCYNRTTTKNLMNQVGLVHSLPAPATRDQMLIHVSSTYEKILRHGLLIIFRTLISSVDKTNEQ